MLSGDRHVYGRGPHSYEKETSTDLSPCLVQNPSLSLVVMGRVSWSLHELSSVLQLENTVRYVLYRLIRAHYTTVVTGPGKQI